MRGKNVSRKHRRGAPRTRKHRRARRQSGGAMEIKKFPNLDLFSDYLQRHPRVSMMQAFPEVYNNGDFYQGAITDEIRNKPSTLVLYNNYNHTDSISITDDNISTFTFFMYEFN